MHLHSVVFSAWLLVFIAQTRLVAAQRVDLHMKLGVAAVVLAPHCRGDQFCDDGHQSHRPAHPPRPA